MRIHRSLLPALVLLAILFPAPALAQGGPPPAQVTLGEVRTETLVRRRAVTGEIRSRLTSRVASQVEGLLLRLGVDEGDTVEQGQVIAKLDDERARISLSRAQADLDFAKAVVDERLAEWDNAKRDLARIEELDRLGSAGVSQLDRARTLVSARRALHAQSLADLATKESSLALAQRELEDMSIEAPFSGRVVRKASEIGQWVGRGDEIVTIVSLDTLEARIDIPEDSYPAVRAAGEAHGQIELRLPALGLGAGQEIFGEVISILPSADSLSRLFPVRIAVDNDEGLLRPGMSLTAYVPTGLRGDYTTVHKDAIVRTASGEVVYFANDGVSAIAPIERLFVVGDRVAIRSPMLRAGMSVVVSGNERMFPGQGLIVLPEPRGAELGGEGLRTPGVTDEEG